LPLNIKSLATDLRRFSQINPKPLVTILVVMIIPLTRKPSLRFYLSDFHLRQSAFICG
jgi:hypothetical protein